LAVEEVLKKKRRRKTMARCGRAEEEEVNVDTRQQSSNKVRTTEKLKRY
jgi:hypothetical protein